MEVFSMLSVIFFGISLAYGDQEGCVSRRELLALIEPLQQEIQRGNDINHHQSDLITQMNETISRLTKGVDVSTAVREYYTAMGCLSEEITLSCPSGGIIDLTNGNYGQFATSCSTCCPPNPFNDCVEDIEENRPSDWLALVALCQNQSSCVYEYQGSTVDQCQEGYVADYMQIYYSCTSGSSNQAVGFTAFAATSEMDYLTGEIILFDDVVENIGGSYNVKAASFLCPVDGVFVFSVSLMSHENYGMWVEIMIDNVQLVDVWADNLSGYYGSSTNLVISQCIAGQTVWTRAGNNGRIYNNSRRSTFSGFLLNRI